MAKLWDKGSGQDKKVEEFTVGKDHILDRKLLVYDCKASKSHVRMLGKAGILDDEEAEALIGCLEDLISQPVEIRQSDEDCHTAIENHLVTCLGELGKKVHTCRSRNDQVLTALRLYEKEELKVIVELVEVLQEALERFSEKHGDITMPGYTHMQKAMPLPLSMWAGCFIEALGDDKEALLSVLKMVDRSPLGTAAGFGVPVYDIDREFAASDMGMKGLIRNPLYAQLSRVKVEYFLIDWLGAVMLTLNKIATDLITFSMKEFGFFRIPEGLCTGSSIMPQKHNPDVLELIRGYYHVVSGEAMKLKGMGANLISGYNRDMQLSKEPVMNSIEHVKNCLEMAGLVIDGVEVDKENCSKACSPEIYATEEAYELAKKMPFRDAYQEVAKKYL